MLENVKELTIRGGYFETPVVFNFLKGKVNIVFGRNGGGKTTISRALREFATKSLEDCEHQYSVSFDRQMEPSEIFVFNEDFINEKISLKEGPGLDTIVMLGQQVEIDRLLDEKKRILSEKKKDYKLLLELMHKMEDVKYEESLKRIFTKEVKPAFSEWADNDAKINKPESTRKSSFTEESLEKIRNLRTTLSSSDTIDSISAAFRDKFQLYLSTNDAVPISFQYEAYNLPIGITELSSILNKHVEQPPLSDRDKVIALIAASSYGNYITFAKDLFKDESISVCPLCQRRMSNEEKKEVVKRIERFLNKEAKDYQEYLENLKKCFVELPSFSLDIFSVNPSLLDSANKMAQSIFVLNKYLENIRLAIEQKLSNIFVVDFISLPIEKIELAFKDYEESINNLLEAIKHYNQMVENRQLMKNELHNLNDKLAYLCNKGIIDKYVGASKKRDKVIEDEKKSRIEIDLLEQEIINLEQEKRQATIALDFINQSLSYIFFDNQRLVLEPGDGCYKLKSKGRDVLPSKISKGECNAIGLCYFFASLFEGKENKTKYANEMLVLLDDPVSSFDMENKVGVLSFLHSELKKIKEGNTNSKTVVLTHDLQVAMDIKAFVDSWFERNDHTSVCTFILESQKLTEKNLPKVSEYGRLLKNIYDFAANENEGESKYFIGNCMRRVLEAFFTFNYASGFSDVNSLDILLEDSDKKEHFKNLMMRFLLNDESHYENRIKSLASPIDVFSISEKRRMAKEILCLLFCLNKYHIRQILGKQICDKIETWTKKIPII